MINEEVVTLLYDGTKYGTRIICKDGPYIQNVSRVVVTFDHEGARVEAFISNADHLTAFTSTIQTVRSIVYVDEGELLKLKFLLPETMIESF